VAFNPKKPSPMRVVAEIGNKEYYCHSAIVELQEALEANSTTVVDAKCHKALQLIALARSYND